MAMHPVPEILRHFDWQHLPPNLAAVSRRFARLAGDCAAELEGPELAAGLRKLLEAKDCMVRAALEADKVTDPVPPAGPRP